MVSFMPSEDAEATRTLNVEQLLTQAGIKHTAISNRKSPTRLGELRLVIQGVVERFRLHEDFMIVLGRASKTMTEQPDVDLTPYQASSYGVSRWHAMIYMEDSILYIKDLSSTNGTFMGGKHLEPNQPVRITKGDDLMLGRMQMQLLFRIPKSK